MGSVRKIFLYIILTCSKLDHLVSGLLKITTLQKQQCLHFAFLFYFLLAIFKKSLFRYTRSTFKIFVINISVNIIICLINFSLQTIGTFQQFLHSTVRFWLNFIFWYEEDTPIYKLTKSNIIQHINNIKFFIKNNYLLD